MTPCQPADQGAGAFLPTFPVDLLQMLQDVLIGLVFLRPHLEQELREAVELKASQVQLD